MQGTMAEGGGEMMIGHGMKGESLKVKGKLHPLRVMRGPKGSHHHLEDPRSLSY